eukprot:NODE_505_length_6682_cov_0.825394.p5 type:complete len:183 gc:universal NODE_505_length_6682_cov_0.825394:1929-2477(+)
MISFEIYNDLPNQFKQTKLTDKTIQTYTKWIRRYMTFCDTKHLDYGTSHNKMMETVKDKKQRMQIRRAIGYFYQFAGVEDVNNPCKITGYQLVANQENKQYQSFLNQKEDAMQVIDDKMDQNNSKPVKPVEPVVIKPIPQLEKVVEAFEFDDDHESIRQQKLNMYKYGIKKLSELMQMVHEL